MLSLKIGVQLFYNVVLVSTVQRSESAICIHISPLFWISFSALTLFLGNLALLAAESQHHFQTGQYQKTSQGMVASLCVSFSGQENLFHSSTPQQTSFSVSWVRTVTQSPSLTNCWKKEWDPLWLASANSSQTSWPEDIFILLKIIEDLKELWFIWVIAASLYNIRN